MSGESDLTALLCGLTATLDRETYVFVTREDRLVPDGLHVQMLFQEREGATLIITQSEAIAHQLPYEFPSRMITLNAHSALEAVGFIARIATELAAQGMGVNPVAGYFHDHLFVPVDRAEDAMAILAEIQNQAQAGATA